jgi:hypothetical protein
MTPEQGRSDWQGILATNMQDPRMRYVLEAIIESVMIDYIENNMAHNDEFAVVIGRRIQTMLNATTPRARIA